MRQITDIAVHGSWTRPELDIGAEEIRRWHVEENGWRDIGYHYVVRRDGTIEPGRPEAQQGAHVLGFNGESIGICLVGGRPSGSVYLDDSWDMNYTEEQMASVGVLLDRLICEYPEVDTVQGHRDYPDVTKACPGFDVQAYYGAALEELLG